MGEKMHIYKDLPIQEKGVGYYLFFVYTPVGNFLVRGGYDKGFEYIKTTWPCYIVNVMTRCRPHRLKIKRTTSTWMSSTLYLRITFQNKPGTIPRRSARTSFENDISAVMAAKKRRPKQPRKYWTINITPVDGSPAIEMSFRRMPHRWLAEYNRAFPKQD